MYFKILPGALLLAALASGQIITDFAGNGIAGYSGDNGPAAQAKVNRVVGLATDASGNIYLADQNNNVVRKVAPSGTITTFAGTGAQGFSGDFGPATQALLNQPSGVCVAPSGVVYVNDQINHRVRAISTSGIITTVAGSGSALSFGDGGPATSAGLENPIRCAVDQSGNLYIVDQNAHDIRKVSTSGVITTFAGVANAQGFSGDNGPAVAALMNNPTAATFDAAGNLYVTDQVNHRIRKIDTSGTITTVAGNGINAFAGDHTAATTASLNFPGETAFDAAGNLFIVDSGNEVIRMVSGGIITTVAGTPATVGNNGDGGPPSQAQFNNPFALTIDPAANLYVGDITNNRVRKIAGLATASSPCTYTLSSGGQGFPAAGGSGSITITTGIGCPWSMSGAPLWITGATSGSGNGTLTYQVAQNVGSDQSVTVTVAGLLFTIEQEGGSIPGLNFIGSMPHIAAEENWTTLFTLVNKTPSSAEARLSFFGDAIDPTGNGPLALPLAFPQQVGSTGPLLTSSFDRPLPANASLIVTSAGAQVPPVLVGSAQLSTTGAVDGFAIFHQIPTAQEAVVPMETRNASSYLLAFDNTNQIALGVAVDNVSTSAGNVGVIVRDDNGAVLTTGSLAVPASGHSSFVLATQYPVTDGKRGTIEFDTPAGGQISVLGIRFTPPNSALTTIPALANVGTTGGSIAHIATGNGWQTTFVLVNTGTTTAQVTLNFYSDVTGAPLSLPLAFPQLSSSTTTVNSTVSQPLAPGATLLVQSTAPASDPAPTVGSAQLITNGNVGGFVIFRYNPNGQEAVVPLESRAATGYIIAFDNTNGTATGVSINSVSTQAVNVPVLIRNDAGAVIGTDTLPLAANGHLSFTLGSSLPGFKYSQTANIRGTLEFDTPAGAQIGALGIRIPIAHTFTTLPALAK
jgi:sugar lactone lactonase YvrE